MMLKYSVDTEAGNKAIKSGQMEKEMMKVMETLKPEAAYFTPYEGLRTGFIFFDLKEVSDIPSIVEPLFMEFDAEVEFHPVMNAQDLKTGLEKVIKG
jgi:hypothetical protein